MTQSPSRRRREDRESGSAPPPCPEQDLADRVGSFLARADGVQDSFAAGHDQRDHKHERAAERARARRRAGRGGGPRARGRCRRVVAATAERRRCAVDRVGLTSEPSPRDASSGTAFGGSTPSSRSRGRDETRRLVVSARRRRVAAEASTKSRAWPPRDDGAVAREMTSARSTARVLSQQVSARRRSPSRTFWGSRRRARRLLRLCGFAARAGLRGAAARSRGSRRLGAVDDKGCCQGVAGAGAAFACPVGVRPRRAVVSRVVVGASAARPSLERVTRYAASLHRER